MAKLNKSTKRDKQREAARAAMPDVQKLVRKYGRAAVANCLHKIQLRDREMKKLDTLKKQVGELERGLRA
jgi:hypothetical protein